MLWQYFEHRSIDVLYDGLIEYLDCYSILS